MADEFGKFKATLCEDLTIAACKKLCAYFGLSAVQTESILDGRPQGLALLNQLECKGKIEPGDLHELHDAFENLGMVAAAKKVDEYQKSMDVRLPDSLDSDEDVDVPMKQFRNITFEELKRNCGITEKLTLNNMLEIKDPQALASQADRFWAKITALDCRIISSDLPNENTLSVRDLIFAILHSSDNHLRNDIVNKMASCQLAVPLVVNGAESNKPLFFYWAFRTIRKKFKTSTDKDPIERPICQHAIFTVSFLRIGDVRVSKSNLLNLLLSECQGYHIHSFFTNKLNDIAKPIFSSGSIEVVWYTPHEGDRGFLEEATTFFNLRGDSQTFSNQTEFICKVSNLIVALIGKQNWQTYKKSVDNIKVKAKNVIFLAIKETDEEAKAPLEFKQGGIVVVRKVQMSHLNEVLCRKIDEIQKSLSDSDLLSLEDYKDPVKDLFQLDAPREYLHKIKDIVDKIVCREDDVKLFKKKILSLNPMWLKWAELDNTPIAAESNEAYSREEHIAVREETQLEERKKQLNTGLSEEVKHFWELLNMIVDSKNYLIDDCLVYLQAVLFDLTYKYRASIESSKQFIYDRMSHKTGDTEVNIKLKVDLRKTYLMEMRDEWEMRIGIEDFIRELGQLYEAHVHCSDDHELPAHIVSLPFLAAQFLVMGNSLEILDDRSYCIPRIWVSSIIDELSTLLGETAKVMVLSVIGVQSSGKSTLLNSMFGTKFPVSAGRCTRGLFIRLLQVEESYAMELGCKYIIVIDTEGLKADHGGLLLDKVSNRRLDNKMATLAMCMADLIIVNIEGELISSDMTNFLEIAAYAFIRMKEVNLRSQCRIVQQRVCDITAPVKNRNNMRKIIYDLNEAVQNVAKAEGFVDSYESFSEIFQLNIDDHTQYVPNLWSGNMNPPNHLYGEVVNKFKNQILDSIQRKELQIQYTFQKFRNRLISVDKALKEENFVLNFEDVSKAIAYNNFSLHCNKWLGDVRVKVTDRWITWQRKIKTFPSSEREQLAQNFKDEIANDIEEQREQVMEQFKLYLESNNDENYEYKDKYSTWIEASLSNIQSEIHIKISNEVKALQWVSTDVPSFVAEMIQLIRLKAAEKATSIRESVSEKSDTQHLQECFEKFWDESKNAILKKYQLTKVSKQDIIKECSTLLQKLCTGTAMERDVLRLLDSEGDISYHSEDFDCEMYIPNKNITERVWNAVHQFRGKRENTIKNIKVHVEEVKNSVLRKFETDCYGKAFDPYLVNTTLQKAFANITLSGHDNIKLPHSLIAKVLLHLCGKISELATNNNNKHQMENPCEELFDKQKSEINLDFKAFYDDRYQNDRAYQHVCKLIFQQFTRFTLDSLRSSIIAFFNNNVIRTKHNLHALVLNYLFEKKEPLLYIDYINNNVEFLINWLKERMIDQLGAKNDNMSWIQSQYEKILGNIHPLSMISLIRELSTTTSMRGWCEKFSKSLSEQQQIQLDLQEAFVYQVSNIAELSTNVVTFYQRILGGEMKTNAQLPEPGNFGQCETFLQRALNCPYEVAVRNFLGCQAQCPFCKAPCYEENLADHTHKVICHYPRGLTGQKWESDKLVEEFCTSSIASDETCYENNGRFFLYKDYKDYYPSWEMQTIGDENVRYYWMWVFHLINDYCATYFQCEPAKIPKFWASEYVFLRAKSVFKNLSFSENMRLSLHFTKEVFDIGVFVLWSALHDTLNF